LISTSCGTDEPECKGLGCHFFGASEERVEKLNFLRDLVHDTNDYNRNFQDLDSFIIDTLICNRIERSLCDTALWTYSSMEFYMHKNDTLIFENGNLVMRKIDNENIVFCLNDWGETAKFLTFRSDYVTKAIDIHTYSDSIRSNGFTFVFGITDEPVELKLISIDQ